MLLLDVRPLIMRNAIPTQPNPVKSHQGKHVMFWHINLVIVLGIVVLGTSVPGVAAGQVLEYVNGIPMAFGSLNAKEEDC